MIDVIVWLRELDRAAPIKGWTVKVPEHPARSLDEMLPHRWQPKA